MSETSTRHFLLKELAGIVVAVLVLVGVWEVAYLALPRNVYFVDPWTTVLAFFQGSSELWKMIGVTCLMLLIGYVIAVAFAFLLAGFAAISPTVRRSNLPIVLLVGSIPTVVIVPILLLLLGRGLVTIIVVIIIVTFLQAYLSLLDGLTAISPALIDYVRVSGGGILKQLRSVRVPAAIPAFITAARLTLPAALSGVILAEIIATGTGIGSYINFSKAYFEYPQVWAGIFAVLLISAFGYGILSSVERRLRDRYVTK